MIRVRKTREHLSKTSEGKTWEGKRHVSKKPHSSNAARATSILAAQPPVTTAPASSQLRIRHTPANKDGSLPQHWDVLPPRGDESLATVWTSEKDAHAVAELLAGKCP